MDQLFELVIQTSMHQH